MSTLAQSDRIVSGKSGSRLLPQLIDLTLEVTGDSEFLTAALQLINSETQADFAALVQGIKGQWRTKVNH